MIYRCIICTRETEAEVMPSRCPGCGSSGDGLKVIRASRREPPRRAYNRPSIPELLTSLEKQLKKVNLD